jgi:hypothetical protein
MGIVHSASPMLAANKRRKRTSIDRALRVTQYGVMMRETSMATRIRTKIGHSDLESFEESAVLARCHQFGISLRRAMLARNACLDRKPKVFAHDRTTFPSANDAQSRRNRRHNHLRFVVVSQCAVPSAPLAERNSSQGAAITDDVWRGSFHGADRSQIPPCVAYRDGTLLHFAF